MYPTNILSEWRSNNRISSFWSCSSCWVDRYYSCSGLLPLTLIKIFSRKE
ncbi:hypothetical protein [uncultured Dokdonia sp.]